MSRQWHEEAGIARDWAYRLMWIAIAAFFAVAWLTGCGRVDLHRSVDGMSKALRVGAVGLDQADQIIEDATAVKAAWCSSEKTQQARAQCMGLLNAEHQNKISDLLVQLDRFYDEAAKSLPKIEAILRDLDRYLKAAKAAR